jgi:hypothetical protein
VIMARYAALARKPEYHVSGRIIMHIGNARYSACE